MEIISPRTSLSWCRLAEYIHHGVTQCNHVASIRYRERNAAQFNQYLSVIVPSTWTHNSSLERQGYIGKMRENWERLSVCGWYLLPLHVLLLTESDCENYGPYKVPSSCGWQKVYILLDRRSWLPMLCETAAKISLWVTMQGICLCVGWCTDLEAWPGIAKYILYPCVFVLLFPNSSPPSPYLNPGWNIWNPHHIYAKTPRLSLYAHTSFRVLFYQLLQSVTNLTCINIRVYSFSACSRKPFRSTACFPASCSPHCLVFILLCFIHVSYLSSLPIIHS